MKMPARFGMGGSILAMKAREEKEFIPFFFEQIDLENVINLN